MKENKTMNILVATFMVLSIANISINLLRMKKSCKCQSGESGGCSCQKQA
ncbi:hypothetical protein N8089_03725 [Flavobacteriales bacterium]|nr:hypothetical protein [Flavobacteriales bacterium]